MRGMWVIFCIMFVSVALAEDDFTFSEIGHALCGYNQFMYNSVCYDYDDPSAATACKATYGSACLNSFIYTSDELDGHYPFAVAYGNIGHAVGNVYTAGGTCDGIAAYGSACLNSFIYTSDELDGHYPFAVAYGNIGHAVGNVYTAGGTCDGIAAYGSACLNSFIYTSDELDEHYPFEIVFSNVSYTLNNYANKLEQDCLGTMDGYYTMNMSQYSKLVDSQCADGSSEYEILNDCQNIDMSIADASDTRSPLHPDNMMCAVLCNSGSVYSSTGACLEYCHVNGQQKRFHILRDGTHIEFPLWADALTTPAVHIQFEDKTVCHLNLTTDVKKDALGIKYQDTVYYSTK